jgi:hypothetical protein
VLFREFRWAAWPRGCWSGVRRRRRAEERVLTVLLVWDLEERIGIGDSDDLIALAKGS